jgi:polyisoprenoid-binding protein YceI
MFGAALAALLVATSAATSIAATWNIDTVHSVLSFKVRHLFSNTAGKFNEWSGTLEFDPAAIEKGSAQITIKTASVSTNNEKRDQHLQSADFFDAANHPEITFKSTSVKKSKDGFELAGDLTMRGVTKPITIPFKLLGTGKDPWGGMRAGFSGAVTVNRKDFGINWNKALDTGGTLLSDEVTIELEVEAAQAAS